MAYPQDSLNNQIKFGTLIRDGFKLITDNDLEFQKKTWIYSSLRRAFGTKIGSNPGNIILESNSYTTQYNIVEEKARSAFREGLITENTSMIFNDLDTSFQIETPIVAGITKTDIYGYQTFMLDEQNGQQVSMDDEERVISFVNQRLYGMKEKADEILAKVVDYKIFELLFAKDYNIIPADGSVNVNKSTIKLSYDLVKDAAGTVSDHTFEDKIVNELVFSEDMDRDDEQALGMIVCTQRQLDFLKHKWLSVSGANLSINTIAELDKYNNSFRTSRNEFMFPNGRILYRVIPYHLSAWVLDNTVNPALSTKFVMRFISRHAIDQINFLMNDFDNISRLNNVYMDNQVLDKTGIINKSGGEFKQTYHISMFTEQNKFTPSLHFTAAMKMALKPWKPARACATIEIDQTAFYGTELNSLLARAKADATALQTRFGAI